MHSNTQKSQSTPRKGKDLFKKGTKVLLRVRLETRLTAKQMTTSTEELAKQASWQRREFLHCAFVRVSGSRITTSLLTIHRNWQQNWLESGPNRGKIPQGPTDLQTPDQPVLRKRGRGGFERNYLHTVAGALSLCGIVCLLCHWGTNLRGLVFAAVEPTISGSEIKC